MFRRRAPTIATLPSNHGLLFGIEAAVSTRHHHRGCPLRQGTRIGGAPTTGTERDEIAERRHHLGTIVTSVAYYHRS